MFSSLLALVLLLSLHFLQFLWSSHPAKAKESTEKGRQALENDFIGSALRIGLFILFVSILCLFSAGIAGPFIEFHGHDKYSFWMLVFPGVCSLLFLIGVLWLWSSGLLRCGTPKQAFSRLLTRVRACGNKPSEERNRDEVQLVIKE